MSYVWKKKRLFVYFHERVKRLHVDILEKKYFNYKTQLPGQGREKKKIKNRNIYYRYYASKVKTYSIRKKKTSQDEFEKKNNSFMKEWCKV